MKTQLRTSAAKCPVDKGAAKLTRTQLVAWALQFHSNSAASPRPSIVIKSAWAFADYPTSPQRECDSRIRQLPFVKGRGGIAGEDTIAVMGNQILTSLNKPDDCILAIVEFLDGGEHRVYYIRRPFRHEPDFGVTSANYALAEPLTQAEEPG